MWIAPIWDRTQQDIDGGNSKGFCNWEDLNRLENNCGELSRLLGVTLETRGQPWTANHLPTWGELDRIARNIRLLSESYLAYQTTPLPPKSPLNHFEKFNDAEKILQDIYRNYDDNRAAYSYSGEMSAGERIGLL